MKWNPLKKVHTFPDSEVAECLKKNSNEFLPSTFPTILICEEWAIITINNVDVWDKNIYQLNVST